MPRIRENSGPLYARLPLSPGSNVNAIASSPADALPQDESPLDDRIRAAMELLAAIDVDRTLLDVLPVDERQRFHQVVAQVYHPEPKERRAKLKQQAKVRLLEESIR